MSHDPYREWSAAYVLGSLEPAERAEFESHLADCAECRTAVMEFAPVPGLLAAVDEADLAPPPEGLQDAVVAAAARSRGGVEQSRRRWRRAATGLAAAAVVLFAVAFAQWADGADDGDPFPGEPVELVVGTDTEDAGGTIVVRGQDWGTFILVDLWGLPARDEYAMWVVTDDGRQEIAGRWAYADSGTCRVPGSTGFPVDSIARIVVTSADQADELIWARGP